MQEDLHSAYILMHKVPHFSFFFIIQAALFLLKNILYLMLICSSVILIIVLSLKVIFLQELDDYRDADDAIYELNGRNLKGDR